MSTTIQIKRRVTGAAGAPASMASGEIAFNEVDKTLYYGSGNSGGMATSIIPIVKPAAPATPDAPSDGKTYGRVNGAWGQALNGTGDVSVTGNFSCGGICKFHTANISDFYTFYQTNGDRWINFAAGYYLVYSPTVTTFTFWCKGVAALDLTSTAALTLHSANAYKTGGGSWLSISDQRIKDVHKKYASGLVEIEQLQPVVYSYKGNDAIPGGISPHHKAAKSGKKFIGLVAQECEKLFPEMVSRRSGHVDGVAVSDLRELDTGPLLYAMLNAIKELSQRLRAAEAKLERVA